jgi:hypothetical protein
MEKLLQKIESHLSKKLNKELVLEDELYKISHKNIRKGFSEDSLVYSIQVEEGSVSFILDNKCYSYLITKLSHISAIIEGSHISHLGAEFIVKNVLRYIAQSVFKYLHLKEGDKRTSLEISDSVFKEEVEDNLILLLKSDELRIGIVFPISLTKSILNEKV